MSPIPRLFYSKVGIMVALEALVRVLRNGTHGAAAAQFDSRYNPSAEGHRLILTGVAVPIFYSQAGAASPGRGCCGPMTH